MGSGGEEDASCLAGLRDMNESIGVIGEGWVCREMGFFNSLIRRVKWRKKMRIVFEQLNRLGRIAFSCLGLDRFY